jgi:hypothetical protein
MVVSGDSCGGGYHFVAIEARTKNWRTFAGSPKWGGSEATYIELVPRATQLRASVKPAVHPYSTIPAGTCTPSIVWFVCQQFKIRTTD